MGAMNSQAAQPTEDDLRIALTLHAPRDYVLPLAGSDGLRQFGCDQCRSLGHCLTYDLALTLCEHRAAMATGDLIDLRALTERAYAWLGDEADAQDSSPEAVIQWLIEREMRRRDADSDEEATR